MFFRQELNIACCRGPIIVWILVSFIYTPPPLPTIPAPWMLALAISLALADGMLATMPGEGGFKVWLGLVSCGLPQEEHIPGRYGPFSLGSREKHKWSGSEPNCGRSC